MSAKHPLDEDRDSRIAEGLIRQVRHDHAGIELDDVELAAATLSLPSRIVRVGVDLEIDPFRLYGPVDERALP
ncbi:MAG: hypothetical protein QF619_12530, partial [Candidatus Binatia bacterium]|nr:hypothetical protein [Candidatus Binatia bacterium]